MDWNAWSYLIFGTTLVVTFLWIIVHFYRPKRKNKVEEPKYKMLDDED
ncbi:MAG: cbb3-type cytochrome c oxidase subunit 3 [Nitrospirae bacterium]|nr:cbb3-type cytochrome c oxidase subunit 3 [Nitrospirota bacterium]